MKLLSLIILFFLSFHASADNFCKSKDFDSITRNCIKNATKFEELRKSFSSLSYGSVFYYVTSRGKLGKLFIHDVVVTKNSCQIHFDYQTFSKGGFYSRSYSKTLKNSLGVWDSDYLDLDSRLDKPDILIQNYENKCYLETDRGKIFYAGKLSSTGVKSSQLLFYVALFLIGLSVFNVAKFIFEDEDSYRSSEAIEEKGGETPPEMSSSFILKYSIPFFRRYVSPVVNGMKSRRKITQKYKKPLASAGVAKYLSPVDFYSFKIFSIITFPVIFLALRGLFEADWSMALVPLMAILGFVYPDIWVKSQAEKRREEVTLGMPFALDMLALSVEAGLDFVAAMRKVITNAPKSALVDEFESAVKEIQLGSTRAQALKQMAWRVDTLTMTSFCATLIAADSVGASVGPILKSLSVEMRNKKSAIVEKRGAEAASKLLIPMVVFILPAILVVIFVPMLLDFV